ncbi:MAG: UDP-N-acetylmuramate:L-alanyl-gamma-D-glutamyl-me so-diaminopimelate ligase [Gammaproteobacteria bacterium]
MHLHILGICGTFMGGVALLARELGHRVTGQDANVYPPMSTLLESAGIVVEEGYDAEPLHSAPDCVVIGNALSRGNPAVEYILERGLRYTSGPQWLADHLLADRWVVAVAGTHGKTTTAGMVAWILEQAGLQPGFLIGGVPGNFDLSARLGRPPFFVVEADEYDTAFFDKRSKFIHYRPRTAVLNNLEFDHADIFPDLASIQRQFHHLVRTVPGNGLLIRPAEEPALDEVFAQGCWTPAETVQNRPGLAASWQANLLAADASRFEVICEGRPVGCVEWGLLGQHNVANGLAALAAARHAGVHAALGVEALCRFRNARRRLEVRGTAGGITIYDDFAHHPTAIAATLEALRARVGRARIVAVLEPRSNTMRMGVHRDALADALRVADRVYLYRPEALGWDLHAVANRLPEADVADSVEAIVTSIATVARSGDHVVVMSNGAFGGIHDKLLSALNGDVSV